MAVDDPRFAADSGELSAALVAGRYQIVRWLGAGGMGRVYEAHDNVLGERVALKVLRGGLSEEALARFRREVKLTRRIQHRNVARMFDIGVHGHDTFLTMELIDGAPLSAALDDVMAWPRLRRLALELCGGLAAAHDAGVIHRDLKPDNVMIERGSERAVITDFGIARGDDEVAVTQVGALMGTPRYMALEQLAGEAADQRADIFALGVMLYELATGLRPWAGDSAVVIAIAQTVEPARPFHAPHVPAAFAELLERCIAIDRTQRPASAAHLAERIARMPASDAPIIVDGAAARAAPDAAARAAPDGAARAAPDAAARVAMDATLVAPIVTPDPRAMPVATPRAAHADTLRDAHPRVAPTTVAVLPVGCAAGDEYLADGLLDDLIDTLSSTGTLRVRPAAIVRSRPEITPRELGVALEVDHIVVCTLRRQPSGLRITARLIGVADGFQIWARREDCREAEILATAERLGTGLATALSARATDSERPTDPRAVELYLRARAELRRFWADHTETAVELLAQAADHAPSSPPILGALAYATVQAWVMRGDPALLRGAQHAVERGLAGGHGEALLAAATLQLNRDDLESAASALGRALVRAPMSAPAHETAGKLLVEIDAGPRGLVHFETALGLDPGRANVISTVLARVEALRGDWDAAFARARDLLADADPSVVHLGAVLAARLAGWRRDRAAILDAVGRFVPHVEDAAHMVELTQRAILAGTLDRGHWHQLEQRNTQPGRPQRMQVVGLQLMAELAQILGYPDLAISALGKAADRGLIDLVWLEHCPLFTPLAADLSFLAVRDTVAARAARILAAFRAAVG